MKAHKTQDLFPKFSTPQRLPTSPLRCPQRAGFLSTLKPHQTTTKVKFGSPLRIPTKERAIQTSGTQPQPLGVPGTSSRLGERISKSNEHKKVDDEDAKVLLLGNKELSQRFSPIFSLDLKDEGFELWREWRSSRSEECECISNLEKEPRPNGGMGVYLYPLEKSSHWRS